MSPTANPKRILILLPVAGALLAGLIASVGSSEPDPRLRASRSPVPETQRAGQPLPTSLLAGRSESRTSLEHKRPGRISGQVVEERGGRVVPGALVSVRGRGNTVLAWMRTGDDGRFHLDHVPAGAEQLAAGADGYLTRREPLGASVEIRLRSAAGLAGVVESPEGLPVAGAVIRVGGRGVFADLMGASGGAVRSGPDGGFELGGLEPGKCAQIIASHPSFADSRPLAVPPDGRGYWTLRLGRPGKLSGRIVDSRGRALAGARVEAAGRVATSAPDGSFRLDGLTPGRTTLTYAHRGIGRELGFEIRVGETNAGNLAIPATTVLAGRVVDRGGRPVAGTILELRHVDAARIALGRVSSGRIRATARSDAQGNFRIHGLRAGRFEIVSGSQALGEVQSDGGPVQVRLDA